MARKRHSDEDILRLLREIELSRGTARPTRAMRLHRSDGGL